MYKEKDFLKLKCVFFYFTGAFLWKTLLCVKSFFGQQLWVILPTHQLTLFVHTCALPVAIAGFCPQLTPQEGSYHHY
jgi:hypothetical protein